MSKSCRDYVLYFVEFSILQIPLDFEKIYYKMELRGNEEDISDRQNEADESRIYNKPISLLTNEALIILVIILLTNIIL